MTRPEIQATITRPDFGSLAYVWIGDKEYVTSSTSEAHALMRRHGEVTYVGKSGKPGAGMTEQYVIVRRG